ncbi:MAG: ABC transporter ATP-binding protein [Planctomycetota bacterium]
MSRSASSRSRFTDYRKRFRQRRQDPIKRDLKGNDLRRTRSFAELLRAFFGLLDEHRLILAAGLTTLTFSTLVALVPLYAPKIVVDNVLSGQPLPDWLASLLPGFADGSPGSAKGLLLILVLATLVLTLLSVAIGLWGRWQATRITKRLQSDVRRRTFEHASRLPLHRVYELKTGGVAGILRDDAGAVGQLVFGMVYNPCRAVIQFLGTLLVLTLIDWKLLLGGLTILPVVWLTHRTWIGRIRPMFRDVRRTREKIDGHATEVFGGIRVVRAFGRQRAESGQFVGNNHLMIRQELNTWWWMRGIDTAWAIIIPLASMMLLLYGGLRILDDSAAVASGTMKPGDALTVGDLVVFLGYLAALLAPVATLAATATTLQNDLAALDRTLDLLEEPRDMPAPDDAVLIDENSVKGEIRFEDVEFAYPKTDQAIFQNLSFVAEPGQTVALVGPSGVGKTTLCNLVARFYDPTAGRVTLDGTDLRDLDVDRYRSLLGVVEQDVFLFDGSVADNIAYARPDATPEDIQHAAEQANAHGFITDLSDGYATLIGERGVKLSGGQRQRLAIARAILADPKILILDEATSNLDTESERLIQASLAGLMHGRTCFVIAHRLSTITHADQILVLSHGRILEQGSHEELMAAGGTYRGMIETQLEAQPV